MTALAINEAKDKLTKAIRSVEKGEAMELTRHGKPVAVLMGKEQYDALRQKSSFSAALEAFLSEPPKGSSALTESDLEKIRSTDSGRDVEL